MEEELPLPVWTALSFLKTSRADKTALDTTLGNFGSPRNRAAGTDLKSRSIHSKNQKRRVVRMIIWQYDVVQSLDVWARHNFGDLMIAVFAVQGHLFVVGRSRFDHRPRMIVSRIVQAHG
jgi:hypothetical protein